MYSDPYCDGRYEATLANPDRMPFYADFALFFLRCRTLEEYRCLEDQFRKLLS
jgi:hypothetical protein